MRLKHICGFYDHIKEFFPQNGGLPPPLSPFDYIPARGEGLILGERERVGLVPRLTRSGRMRYQPYAHVQVLRGQ